MKIDDDSLYDVAFGTADAETDAAVEAEAAKNPELAERLADLKAIVAAARDFEANDVEANDDFDRRFGEVDLKQDFADICAAIEGKAVDEEAESESASDDERSAQVSNAPQAFREVWTPETRDAIFAGFANDASPTEPVAAKAARERRKTSAWTRPDSTAKKGMNAAQAVTILCFAAVVVTGAFTVGRYAVESAGQKATSSIDQAGAQTSTKGSITTLQSCAPSSEANDFSPRRGDDGPDYNPSYGPTTLQNAEPDKSNDAKKKTDAAPDKGTASENDEANLF